MGIHESGTWVEVGEGSATGGGVSDNAGSSMGPSLALDNSGNPVVAWVDETSGTSGWDPEIYIKRFDDTTGAWVEVGEGSATGGGISDNDGPSACSSLTLDRFGNPVVAWEDSSSGPGDDQIYVIRFDDTSGTWVEVGAGSDYSGGVSNSSSSSRCPSLGISQNGRKCVAWHEYGKSSMQIVLRCSDL